MVYCIKEMKGGRGSGAQTRKISETAPISKLEEDFSATSFKVEFFILLGNDSKYVVIELRTLDLFAESVQKV